MRNIYWRHRRNPGADNYEVPSTDDLMLVPEMASVHLLHEAVGVAARAMRMLHEAPPRRSATQVLAAGLVPLLRVLDTLLAKYREACLDDLQALAERDQNDDDPF